MPTYIAFVEEDKASRLSVLLEDCVNERYLLKLGIVELFYYPRNGFGRLEENIKYKAYANNPNYARKIVSYVK